MTFQKKNEAIREAEKLKLTDNQFYFALLGDLYTGIDNLRAKENFEHAFETAKTDTDKNVLKKKISALK